MRFIKMHGAGNDYVVLDALAEPMLAHRSDLIDLARGICDRHHGIGADGMLLLAAPEELQGASPESDLVMRIFNADGSDVVMCGNGARCAAKFAVDRGYVVPTEDGRLVVQVGPRNLRTQVKTDRNGMVESASINMGAVSYELATIPADESRLEPALAETPFEYQINGHAVGLLSLENPHAVAFLEAGLDDVDLARHGQTTERHPAFAHGINLHIVHALSESEVQARSWERGVGLTQACGTGACAIVAHGVRTGRLSRNVRVRMPGGILDVQLMENNDEILLTGLAEEVFQGDWPG